MRKGTDYYIIKHNNRYFSEIEHVHDITTCIDVFYSEDEIRAQLGLKRDAYFSTYSPNINLDRVKAAVLQLDRQLTANKNKPMKIEDKELVEFFKSTNDPITQYVKRLRRRGDVVYAVDTSVLEKKVNMKDVSQMMYNAKWTLQNKYNVDVQFSSFITGRINYINMMKKLVNFDEVFKKMGKHLKKDELRILNNKKQRLKAIWNNPKLCAPKAAKK